MTNLIASEISHVYQETDVTKDDEQTMDALGITCESKSVYHYKGFRYERLADAVRFAQSDTDRRRLWDGDS